jgi:hypothetical protein
MKCFTVLDKQGKFLAMAYSERLESEADDGLITRGGPVAEADQTVVELYMPDKYSEMPIIELIEQVQADLNARGRPATKSK